MECALCKQIKVPNKDTKNPCFPCDSCKRQICIECSELCSSEIKCMPLQRRVLKFVCIQCRNFELYDILSKSVEDKQKIIDSKDEIINLLKEKIKTLEDNAQIKEFTNESNTNLYAGLKPQFADVVKQKREPVLIVKPTNNQGSDETKKAIKSLINPIEIGVNISGIRQASKGTVIIGCESQSDRNLLKTKFADKLGNNYNIEVPKLKCPKIKVININNDDLETNDEDIVDKIIKQNKINCEVHEFNLRILKKIENKKFKNSTVILETDPETHNDLLKKEKLTIGWSRGRLFNHLHVTQCFKCLGFNHVAKACTKTVTCSICSAENHSHKDCVSDIKKCINCVKAKTKLNLDLDVNHEAVDKNCPCYLRSIKKLNNSTDYHNI